MSGLIRTRPSPDRVVPAPATGGSRHRGAERWGPPRLRRRSPPGSHQGQHGPRLARASPLLPQSPPPTLSLPLLRSPEPRQTPLRPRPAPLSRLPQPGIRPAAPSPGAMGAPPGYRPSAWVHLLHQLPRADFQLRPVPSGFAPQEQEYQQVGAGAGVLGAGARRVGRAEGSRGRRGLGGRVLCSPQVGAGPGLRGI